LSATGWSLFEGEVAKVSVREEVGDERTREVGHGKKDGF
jgi:hypothetical protein